METKHDTTERLTAIHAVMAAHGMYGSDALTCLQAVAKSHLGKYTNIAAGHALGIPDEFTSFTDFAERLAHARANMAEEEYQDAIAARFGSDGMRFAAMATTIHEAIQQAEG